MKQIEISGRPVGENYPAYVIVEIGINHNGDLETAKRLMEVAADAGADAVKSLRIKFLARLMRSPCSIVERVSHPVMQKRRAGTQKEAPASPPKSPQR